jgi:hypothetical protein
LSAWAKPGVRCVCIDDALIDLHSGRFSGYVVKGEIYKIVKTLQHSSFPSLGLALWGMPLDQYFDVCAFRPLVELSDDAAKDVALFKKIAGHVPAPETEQA